MKIKVAACLFFSFFLVRAYAQHQPVFPDLSGQELLDQLAIAYQPYLPLTQAQARDTLFARIYSHDDSLTCVYTGFTIWLDPTMDPTQAAFMDNSPDAINTEHTFPQSLGATGLAGRDMHHLYPTRADVNAARGNSAFAEIPDNETEKWFYLNQQTTSIPSAQIDSYSELKGELFEPREDHKGNVARAMFYFYTMYEAQANATYFETQRQTLCAWHLQDPVDQEEWDRTWRIAQYQDGKPNPFVLDCTLAERSYCGDSGQICFVSTEEKLRGRDYPIAIKPAPNPMREGAAISFSLPEAAKVKLEVFNLTGKKMETLELGRLAAGEQRIFWERKSEFTAGIYFLRFSIESERSLGAASAKVIVLP